jgi:hypothetical protein
MPMFRKKPVVIEAVQLTWENWNAICDFVPIPKVGWCIDDDLPHIAMVIDTLEGTHKANENDWIIKGVNGEFYPCKPDIFEKTYEAVEA